MNKSSFNFYVNYEFVELDNNLQSIRIKILTVKLNNDDMQLNDRAWCSQMLSGEIIVVFRIYDLKMIVAR